jgi:Amt family ammonium transporter
VGGLVAITPAAGFVNITGAIVIGIAAGIIPFFAVALLKPKLGYDDTLDAFGIHGVGGTIGAILTGVFADPSINDSAGAPLWQSRPALTQICLAITLSTAVWYGGHLHDHQFTVGLRVEEEDESSGGRSQHGEKAYNIKTGLGSGIRCWYGY